jgi:hypothetical protein
VNVRLNTALNAANGGAWVVESISGGYANIPTAPTGDMTKKAANMAAIFAATDGYQVVDVSGSTDTALTQAQYGVAMLKLTGVLGASKNLILPAQSGQWIIDNEATGNFNVTAKAAGSSGSTVILPAGSPVIVCSDGTNVKFASAGGQSYMKAYPFSGLATNTLTITGGYTPGAIIVERNGALQEPGTAATPDYTATDGATVVLATALTADETATVYTFATFSVANAVQKSGDTMGGALALYAGSTVSAPAAGDSSAKIPSTAWVGANTPGRLANVQVFAASGFYTPTPGMTKAIFKVQGSGAGTGGAPATGSGAFSGSAGASSGAYAEVLLTAAQIGAGQAITVGPGGTAGAAGSSTGGNGGTVSVGSLISCPGGLPSSSYGPTGASFNVNAPAGLATLPTINAGVILAQTRGNQGGPAIGGVTGGVVAGVGSVSPINGSMSGPGAGAGGTAAGANAGAQAGFAGAPGIVIVEEYI